MLPCCLNIYIGRADFSKSICQNSWYYAGVGEGKQDKKSAQKMILQFDWRIPCWLTIVYWSICQFQLARSYSVSTHRLCSWPCLPNISVKGLENEMCITFLMGDIKVQDLATHLLKNSEQKTILKRLVQWPPTQFNKQPESRNAIGLQEQRRNTVFQGSQKEQPRNLSQVRAPLGNMPGFTDKGGRLLRKKGSN